MDSRRWRSSFGVMVASMAEAPANASTSICSEDEPVKDGGGNTCECVRPALDPGKWYTVFIGKAPRVYSSWKEASAQVASYSNNRHRGFKTRHAAEQAYSDWVRKHGGNSVDSGKVGAIKVEVCVARRRRRPPRLYFDIGMIRPLHQHCGLTQLGGPYWSSTVRLPVVVLHRSSPPFSDRDYFITIRLRRRFVSSRIGCVGPAPGSGRVGLVGFLGSAVSAPPAVSGRLLAVGCVGLIGCLWPTTGSNRRPRRLPRAGC
ncbi:Translational activator GCN1 [Hordeum vulgare]|nr:Translational activator GCN1 [Hordeum vulgare]